MRNRSSCQESLSFRRPSRACRCRPVTREALLIPVNDLLELAVAAPLIRHGRDGSGELAPEPSPRGLAPAVQILGGDKGVSVELQRPFGRRKRPGFEILPSLRARSVSESIRRSGHVKSAMRSRGQRRLVSGEADRSRPAASAHFGEITDWVWVVCVAGLCREPSRRPGCGCGPSPRPARISAVWLGPGIDPQPLTLALLLKPRDAGRALPRAAVALSPAKDLPDPRISWEDRRLAAKLG